MRTSRTGPAITPRPGQAPASTVVTARAPEERELAAGPGATRSGRGIRLLAGGQAASTIGDGCYAVALPWYVLTGHGGAAALGATLAAYGIGRAAAMPAGSLLCDRLGARRVLLLVDVLRAALIGGLAVQAALRPPSLVTLALFSALAGGGEGAFIPSRYALMPAIAPGPLLRRANATLTSARQAGRLAGPLIGALLVARAGPAAAFALDAATFAISALTLTPLRPVAITPQEHHAAPNIRAVLAATPALPIMLLVVLAGNLASSGVFAVALPVLAHQRFGTSGYGLVLAMLAAGAVAGTTLGTRIRSRRPAVTACRLFLAQTTALALFPLAGLTGAAVAAAAFGLANAIGELIIVTTLQRSFPTAALGRIMGLVMLASAGAFPVSVALTTAVVHTAGTAAAFPLAGALTATAILLGLSRTALRSFAAESAEADGAGPLPDQRQVIRDSRTSPLVVRVRRSGLPPGGRDDSHA
jgi:predicted MFS family arabinose efflux permease